MERNQSLDRFVDLLRCPRTGASVAFNFGVLVGSEEGSTYSVSTSGIPLFAEQIATAAARAQEAHYSLIASAYARNLEYPHTNEYMKYLDQALMKAMSDEDHGDCAEICCGYGEVFPLIPGRFRRGIGVDISVPMLERAVKRHKDEPILFIQGDATMLPLASERFHSVFMLGGIHHVPDRRLLFREVARILKPGGRFYFREPLNDFALWRALRAVVYRASPTLDHETERPLRRDETIPVLENVGLHSIWWRSHGFLGFTLLMNSDVLVFNKVFRFIPGIRAITRAATRFDEWCVSLPGLRNAGLQVVGVAEKPGV